MSDYIKWIRERVGHDPIILNAVGAFILNNKNEVLLLRRADRVEEVWGIPGGMMELGESVEETMKREVYEETGLEVKIEKFLGVYTKDRNEVYPNGDKAQVIFFVFVCRPLDDSALLNSSEEAAEFKYFDPNNFPSTFRHPQILKDFISGEKGLIR